MTEVNQLNNQRLNRKLEHIRAALELSPEGDNGFGDAHLIHCALPDLGLQEIDLSCTLFGKKLSAPIIINAITGGTEEVKKVNQSLARVAGRLNLGMAVGSQTAAIKDAGLLESFTIVRKENHQGLILANIGCHLGPKEAAQAVKMVEADALQVHLNVPQELAMLEGERDFRGWLINLQQIAEKSTVPMVVKEVGFGLSREVARQLLEQGFFNLDIGGRGGTNFIAIEQQRGGSFLPKEWGITTLCSLIEVLAEDVPGKVIATGGMRTPLETAKALAIGADAVGMAGAILRVLMEGGEEGLEAYITDFIAQLKMIFLMCGARNLASMGKKPIVIGGNSGQWLQLRGIDLTRWSQRGCPKSKELVTN